MAGYMGRYMFTALAYGVALAVAVVAVGLIIDYPSWTAYVTFILGMLVGGLGPLRHLDWIEGS